MEETEPAESEPEESEPEETGPEETGPEETGPEETGPEETGPEETGPDTGSFIAARMERLQQILEWVGDADVARGLRSFPVAEFDNQSLPIRTALRALRKKNDPATALRQPQYRPTAPLVAEAVSEPCMEAVVTALGDAAEEPDRRQLLAALGEVGDRFPASMIALMLAYVSVTDMAAADICAEILASDERFSAKP